MEPVGAFPDGESDCFRGMFANEERDYSPKYLGQSSLLLGEDDGFNIGIQSTFCSAPEDGVNESIVYALDAQTSNLQHISQESSYDSNGIDHTVFIVNPGRTNYTFSYPDHVLSNNTCTSIDFCMMDEKNHGSFVPSINDIVMEETVSLNEDERSDRSENSDHSQVEPIVFPAKQLLLKRKLDVPELEGPVEDKININSSGNQKKKPRVSKYVQRCMKNGRSKKSLPQMGTRQKRLRGLMLDQMDRAVVVTPQRTIMLLKENSGKTRASRGSATDPQSLYARKRRERINERLRILQNLVPNGTKVDSSTMLEEAVHYVKFLQLQIKRLSSDGCTLQLLIMELTLDSTSPRSDSWIRCLTNERKTTQKIRKGIKH